MTRKKLSANLEWEDPGAIWRNNKNELHSTSAEYIAEDFGDDSRVLAYLDTIGTNHLYCRTLADGTRVYVYRALDGKVYEVTAEDIKRSQQITFGYEMAKVSGEGLAAGGRVNYEGELVPIRPAEPDRPEMKKGILDQKTKAKQAPKSPNANKQDKSRPYPGNKPAGHGSAKNEAHVQKKGGGLAGNARSSDAAGSEQPQQEAIEVEADSTTPNHGYEDKGKLSIKAWPSGLKVAPDGSFAAGIVRGKVVIYVPVQSDNEEGEISPLDFPATSFSLSEDSLWMVTDNGGEMSLLRRGEEVSQWNRVGAFNPSEMVKSVKFSPGGGYIIVTRNNGKIVLINLKEGDNLDLEHVQQLILDERDYFMFVAEKQRDSGMVTVWRMSQENNAHPLPEELFVGDVQSMHLSLDAKMIVILNEHTRWVGRVESRGRINIVNRQCMHENIRTTDVYLDNNFAIIIQHLKWSVILTRITITGEDKCDVMETKLSLSVYDDRTIINAFYIPDGDRVAAIFSDGSMRMWQNIAEKAGTQPLPDDSDFGELLHYSKAKHYFLVRDGAGHVIVRRWR